MIRLILFLALLGAAAFGLGWLADRPGAIMVEWLGYRVETTAFIAAIAVLGLIIASVGTWQLLRYLMHSPLAIRDWFGVRRREKGLRAVGRGLVAVGAGDTRTALRAAQDAHKHLGDAPMTLLLSSQAAQLAGDRKAATATFERMVETQETKALGLRGLFVEATRSGDSEAARRYAEAAVTARPGISWASNAVLAFQVGNSEWDAAIDTIRNNVDNRLIDRDQGRRLKAVVLTAKAQDIEATDRTKAKSYAMEAHTLAPDLVPAAELAARLLSEAGDVKRAARVIETTWKVQPHPQLADAYTHARMGDAARDRLRRARALAEIAPHHPESQITVASAAMEARDFAEARRALTPLTESPTRRVALLMAAIAEAEGKAKEAREWLGRSVDARPDPSWTADGFVAERWLPASPVTAKLDAFQWKAPVEAAPGSTIPVIHLPVIPAPIETSREPLLPPPAAASEPDPQPEPPPTREPVPVAPVAPVAEATPPARMAPAPEEQRPAPAAIAEPAPAAPEPAPAAVAPQEPPARPRPVLVVSAPQEPEPAPAPAPARVEAVPEPPKPKPEPAKASRPPAEPIPLPVRPRAPAAEAAPPPATQPAAFLPGPEDSAPEPRRAWWATKPAPAPEPASESPPPAPPPAALGLMQRVDTPPAAPAEPAPTPAEPAPTPAAERGERKRPWWQSAPAPERAAAPVPEAQPEAPKVTAPDTRKSWWEAAPKPAAATPSEPATSPAPEPARAEPAAEPVAAMAPAPAPVRSEAPEAPKPEPAARRRSWWELRATPVSDESVALVSPPPEATTAERAAPETVTRPEPVAAAAEPPAPPAAIEQEPSPAPSVTADSGAPWWRRKAAERPAEQTPPPAPAPTREHWWQNESASATDTAPRQEEREPVEGAASDEPRRPWWARAPQPAVAAAPPAEPAPEAPPEPAMHDTAVVTFPALPDDPGPAPAEPDTGGKRSWFGVF